LVNQTLTERGAGTSGRASKPSIFQLNPAMKAVPDGSQNGIPTKMSQI
jgi:hypothetical protein